MPLAKRAIGTKWVFKLKCKLHGSIDRYKACLVAKGYTQREGIYYENTFSPAPFVTIVALATDRDWYVHNWMLN